MSKPKIPAIPSIQHIQDPHTRKALQALLDAWAVRNGQTGEEGARFVTREELDGFVQSQRGGPSVRYGTSDGEFARGGIVGSFQGAVQQIIADIQNSALWRKLSSRIDKLDGPGGALERLGLTETGIARYVSETDSKIEVLEGYLVDVEGSIAAVVDTKIAEVTPNFATAQSVTDLQTTVNGVSTNASNALSIAQGVDGSIDASWTVKFDADGYVVGAGLGLEGKDGNYTSQFLVRADRFAVGSPTSPNLFPFIVDSSSGSPLIALNGQVYIGARTLEEVADNASVPAINHIGSFAAAPSIAGLKKNTTYKNTTNGNTYIIEEEGAPWVLWLEKGQDGTNGTNGTNGSNGSDGARGSLTGYGANYGISSSSWSASQAQAVIYNMIYGSSMTSYASTWHLRIGDTVTLSNGSTFAETRYWGGSSWLNPGVVIDGNLLVNGTVSASYLNVGTSTGGVSVGYTNPGSSTKTNGIYVYQNTTSYYGLFVENKASGGGAVSFKSTGGYTLEVNNANIGTANASALTANAQSGTYQARLCTNVGGVGYGLWTNSRSYIGGDLTITGNLTVNGTYPGGGGGGVTSFNSRTGAVTLAGSDVTGALGSTYVQNANYSSVSGVSRDLQAASGTTYMKGAAGSHWWEIQTSGSAYHFKSGVAFFVTTNNASDRRMKEAIANTARHGLGVVDALRVVDYQWRPISPSYDGGVTHTGFIAQEVAQVVPDAVEDAMGALFLHKQELIPYLVKAVQELHAEVQSLKQQLQP